MHYPKVLNFMGWSENCPLSFAVISVISGQMTQTEAAEFFSVKQSSLSRRLTTLRNELARVADLTGVTIELQIKDGRK